MAHETKRVLLNFSFYYNQTKWHFLIKKHINKVLELITTADENAVCFICLSRYCGDNVQLNVLTGVDMKLAIIELVSKDTTIFFKKYPSTAKRITYPINSFFKNFPVNSLQYNLISHQFNNDSATSYQFSKILQNFLNTLIVFHISKNEITGHDIFLTVYYLHILTVKVLLLNNRLNLVSITQVVIQKTSSGAETEQKAATLFFAENELVLANIIKDVLQNHSIVAQKRFFWMTEWMEVCALLFDSAETQRDCYSLANKWANLITQINRQLPCGFEEIQPFILRFIVDKILQTAN